MPRDLFAATFTPRPAPTRSKWTLAGSILAHVGVIGVLLIVPVVSALDTFVLRANDAMLFALPAVVVPHAPPPPASTSAAVAPDINAAAAPVSSPLNPVTAEVPLPAAGGSGVPGAIGVASTAGVPGGTGEAAAVTLAPPPTPTPVRPVRPGGNIKPPARVAYTAPEYPAIARTARIEGTVYLEATIDESGVVRDVRVLRSVPLLDAAAIAAVSRWRYTPTRLNGVAVPIILTVTVTFTLR